MGSTQDGKPAIDIGSTMHMAAVNPDACDTPVRAFGTFTQDLHDLADWFKSCGVTSVAMDSTGVDWIPAFEVLEGHGFHVILVNARLCQECVGEQNRRQRCRVAAAVALLWSLARQLSVPQPRMPPYVPISVSGNGLWNTPLRCCCLAGHRTAMARECSICRRR